MSRVFELLIKEETNINEIVNKCSIFGYYAVYSVGFWSQYSHSLYFRRRTKGLVCSKQNKRRTNISNWICTYCTNIQPPLNAFIACVLCEFYNRPTHTALTVYLSPAHTYTHEHRHLLYRLLCFVYDLIRALSVRMCCVWRIICHLFMSLACIYNSSINSTFR